LPDTECRKKAQKAQNEDEENVTQSQNGRERAQRTQKRDEPQWCRDLSGVPKWEASALAP
jgi:hypothetical protein